MTFLKIIFLLKIYKNLTAGINVGEFVMVASGAVMNKSSLFFFTSALFLLTLGK
ncbi:unnamed protein product, partial [Nesidiocoris tenuis]